MCKYQQKATYQRPLRSETLPHFFKVQSLSFTKCIDLFHLFKKFHCFLITKCDYVFYSVIYIPLLLICGYVVHVFWAFSPVVKLYLKFFIGNSRNNCVPVAGKYWSSCHVQLMEHYAIALKSH